MGVAADPAQADVERGAGMIPAFSPLQQRCLDALGYTLYALAGCDSGASVSHSGEREHKIDSSPSPVRSRATDPGKVAALRPAPTQDDRDTRLLAAVLRAVRGRIDSIADPHAWLIARGVDSIAALRGDPSAKRVLWATLRRERRPP